MQSNIATFVFLSILCSSICLCSPLQHQTATHKFVYCIQGPSVSDIKRKNQASLFAGATSHEILLSLIDTAFILFYFFFGINYVGWDMRKPLMLNDIFPNSIYT